MLPYVGFIGLFPWTALVIDQLVTRLASWGTICGHKGRIDLAFSDTGPLNTILIFVLTEFSNLEEPFLHHDNILHIVDGFLQLLLR